LTNWSIPMSLAPRTFLDTPDGRLAVYGSTRPDVVFVHGTPSWTHEFRGVAARTERWAAVDHLGFGQSDKDPSADHSIAAHQRRFALAMDALEVDSAVFVLHDFGTAIALPWMLRNPDRVRGVVLANTFLWTATGVFAWIARFYASWLGRLMYLYLNVSARVLLPAAWGTRTPLTPELHADYLAPFPTAADRHGPAALPGELVGDSLAALTPRASELGQWPVRIVWGMSDALVGPAELARWRELLPHAAVTELDDVGHFVAEEAPDAIADAVAAVARRDAGLARSA
jgi:haloalkane dehalogenase